MAPDQGPRFLEGGFLFTKPKGISHQFISYAKTTENTLKTIILTVLDNVVDNDERKSTFKFKKFYEYKPQNPCAIIKHNVYIVTFEVPGTKKERIIKG